jgi:hypothetical protein
MIDKALVIIPQRPGSQIRSESLSPLSYVGGLTIIVRVLCTVQWAGISEGIVLSYGGWDEIKALVAKDSKIHSFQWIEHPLTEQDTPDKQQLAAFLRSPFILLSSQWILDRKIIRELCSPEKDLHDGTVI